MESGGGESPPELSSKRIVMGIICEALLHPFGTAESGGGAAGIRTLVQTKHLQAFYMLSLFFNFRHLEGVQATR